MRLFLVVLLLLVIGLSSCTLADPYPDDAYFGDIYSNGILIGGGGLEIDPIFIASPAFGITALNIAGWNALVSSQWITDANGINFIGSVGIHTGSSATSLLTLYSSDGISNDAILDVTDNSASAEAVGIHVNITGVKTDYTDGIYISNIATANTAGADKYGLRIKNTGNWLGVGSVNNCLYIETPTGGTTNYSIYSEGGANYLGGSLTLGGTLDMSDNFINNIKRLNLTDPTTLTIAAGAITVTQGFHLVDTQGGASSDYLDTINGGTIGDILYLSGANDAREIILTRNGNIRFQPEHMIEGFGFISPLGSSGTYYSGGYYSAPATDANLTQASTTVTYGSANAPEGARAFLVAAAAGTTNAGTVSIIVSGVSVTSAGVRTPADSETIVADITAMGINSYYQTTKKWVGTVTYTLTPAGGAAVYAADFNYGFASYDSFDSRLGTIKLIEVFGRAGANDNGFDIQLLHHKATGWTYSAAAFVPGTGAVISLVGDYATDNDLVTNERFSWERELIQVVNGVAQEGFMIKVITTSNKAVELMNISIYAEVVPNDVHLKTTGQSVTLLFNGTNWMKN